jgi:type I restriction enzyme S subunit
VGKTAYWDGKDKFVLSNHMTIIRVVNHELVEPVFLANYLHKRWYDGFWTAICRRHVNQASISHARLSTVLVSVPPLSIQRQIGNLLSPVDEKTEAEDGKKQAIEEHFQTLLKNLMTGKIRVNNLEVPV